MNKDRYFQLSDSELIERTSAGDRSAFSAIYKKYWAVLYNASYKRLRDHSQCEDVLQNVFSDLWIRRERLVIRNLGAFLHGAVRFQVYKVLQTAKLQNVFFESFDLFISRINGDDKLLEDELQILLDAWIEALPPKRRRIFKMRYEQGFSTTAIAAELNISRKTVQNQLNTASTDLTARLARISSVAIACILYS